MNVFRETLKIQIICQLYYAVDGVENLYRLNKDFLYL
jgi:hypothetical protein